MEDIYVDKDITSHTVDNLSTVSVAEVFSDLFDSKDRTDRAEGGPNIEKSKNNAKAKDIFNWVQKQADIKVNNIIAKISPDIYKAGQHHSGINRHYNLLTDPCLGFKKAVLRMIPCGRDTCA